MNQYNTFLFGFPESVPNVLLLFLDLIEYSTFWLVVMSR